MDVILPYEQSMSEWMKYMLADTQITATKAEGVNEEFYSYDLPKL